MSLENTSAASEPPMPADGRPRLHHADDFVEIVVDQDLLADRLAVRETTVSATSAASTQ